MTEHRVLHLFDGYGIELEYMVVDAETLAVSPIVDQLLADAGAGNELEVERGDVAWSNELALHVVELKTNGPSPSLAGVATRFQAQLADMQALLAPRRARLLPTAMHPFMRPDAEFKSWHNGDSIIYDTFDRIFNCRGHGWSNLQSMHINLPFADDKEFGRLHAATRLVLPLLPGLAASSPYIEGRRAQNFDQRLAVYRTNAARVPSVAGHVIPERVFTRKAYEEDLLGRIYRDLAPFDPEGVLRHEWVNARGCIARFDRMALEIRLLDTQECPRADLAIAAAVVAVVKALVQERTCATATQRDFDEQRLALLLQLAIADADQAVVEDDVYLQALGFYGANKVRLGELWQCLLEATLFTEEGCAEWESELRLIQEQGCLARRIVRAVDEHVSVERLCAVYGQLADCLSEGRMFTVP